MFGLRNSQHFPSPWLLQLAALVLVARGRHTARSPEVSQILALGFLALGTLWTFRAGTGGRTSPLLPLAVLANAPHIPSPPHLWTSVSPTSNGTPNPTCASLPCKALSQSSSCVPLLFCDTDGAHCNAQPLAHLSLEVPPPSPPAGSIMTPRGHQLTQVLDCPARALCPAPRSALCTCDHSTRRSPRAPCHCRDRWRRQTLGDEK